MYEKIGRDVGEVKYAKPKVQIGTRSAGALVLLLGRTISDRHLGTPSSASRIVLVCAADFTHGFVDSTVELVG